MEERLRIPYFIKKKSNMPRRLCARIRNVVGHPVQLLQWEEQISLPTQRNIPRETRFSLAFFFFQDE